MVSEPSALAPEAAPGPPTLHAAGGAANPAPAPPAPRRTLLVVDDEAGPRQALEAVFGERYQVLLADSGAAAVELARQHHVDAAVVDIRMAGLSGIEVLALLKQADPAIEVVMLTAYETLETAQQALRLGACDYLAKPFAIPTMRAAIANAMERRSVSDGIRANNLKLEVLRDELKQQHLRQELLRTQGQIYASILHDLNHPLGVILGHINFIDLEISQTPRAEAASLAMLREHLTGIQQQVDLCSEISRGYLRFLRESPADHTWVAVNKCLRLAGQLLRVHPSGKGQEISTRALAAEAWSPINGTELVQILLNLGTNAFQCLSTPHRVEIEAQLVLQPLDRPALADGPHALFLNRDGFHNTAPLVALSVADNGPGIAPELLARIFDPYFTTKPADKGTGLGLPIVLRLAKAARGALQVRSSPGQGAKFTVYLPASLSPPQAAKPR